MKPTHKKFTDRETCESLLALVEMGKARVVKEHTEKGPEYVVFSASGSAIGMIGERWKYIFEKAIIPHGMGDGLFEGQDQTIMGSR